MLLIDIKDANAILHKILPLLPFEQVLATQILQNTMQHLLQSIQTTTYTYFTSKHKIFQYDPYLLQDLQYDASNE